MPNSIKEGIVNYKREFSLSSANLTWAYIFNIGGNCIQLPQMKGECVTQKFLQIKLIFVALTSEVVSAGFF